MRHEIQFEIHCGVECVIVQGPGSTAEDQGSPEASQAWSSHGPKTGLCDCREPIWGDGLGTEPPQYSQGLGTRPPPTTAKQCPGMSLCPQICHWGFSARGSNSWARLKLVAGCPGVSSPGAATVALLCHPNRFGGGWRVGVFPVGCRDPDLSVPVLQGGGTSDQKSERENLSHERRFLV